MNSHWEEGIGLGSPSPTGIHERDQGTETNMRGVGEGKSKVKEWTSLYRFDFCSVINTVSKSCLRREGWFDLQIIVHG